MNRPRVLARFTLEEHPDFFSISESNEVPVVGEPFRFPIRHPVYGPGMVAFLVTEVDFRGDESFITAEVRLRQFNS